MNRILSVFLFLGSFSFSVVAQQLTNTELSAHFSKQYQLDRAKAEKILLDKNISIRRTDANGRVIEFGGFDLRGNIQFNITDNVGAGRTISTNKVWPGGTVGTSLTGLNSGLKMGVWDGGGVRLTHREFVGRVTQDDGAFSIIDHATHVSGTMIGSGISANAKGMAYQATLRAYDWNNDLSEMTSAAGNGMLVSNHSYGLICGWYWDGAKSIWYGDPAISSTEDYRFGYYDQSAAAWDQVMYSNPFYLICKSAGNDRGDKLTGSSWTYYDGSPGVGSGPPADGQYDCISTYSGAKNVLTVGAAKKIGNSNTNNGWTTISDVQMSTFSGWGPMDDGRIKPDVVGCGVSVYSAVSTHDSAYSSFDGTSMATPNVAGSLYLVQQHYYNVKNKYMRASTLKGLTIHTADEAGNIGPDYQFGWGLVNIAKAVQTITDSVTNQIQERTLNNATTYTQSISTAGIAPLRVTICWTDPAGNPVAPALDPANKMLVNDLDIKLTRQSDGAIFYPYILSKDTPSNVARTGINMVDNVEQVYIQSPSAGNYTITVTHKGTLASAQSYSLIISGLMGVPVAIFTSSTKTVCTATAVTFTDNSSGSPTSRNWYFPGGSPSTSTAASTNVSYSVAGKYPVILVVSNALGKDSSVNVNYITAGGNTLPFNETFESNSPTLSSWTISNTNNDTTWRLAKVTGTTPGNTAYCMPFFNYTITGRRDGLITPALSFKGYSSANLTFQHAYATDSVGASDSLVIWASTNCGNTWTRLLSKGENGSGSLKTTSAKVNEFLADSASKWCFSSANNCINVNLNAYAGLNNVKLKFEGYNNYNNNLFIDNVNINGTALLPVANFYASKKTACVGESISYFDSTTNIATTWNWTFTGANSTTSTVQNPTGIIYTTPGTYAVKLVVSNSTGADSITKTSYITVVANPAKPTVTGNKGLSICQGDSVILSSDITGSTYQWKVNGSKVGGAFNQSLAVTASGNYSVLVYNVSGCSTASDSVAVMVNPYPAKPTVTSNLSSDFMCTGGTATLSSSANTGNQWYKNGNIMSGSTANLINTTDSGSFTVQISNGGCLSPFSDPKSVVLLPLPATSVITGLDAPIRTRTEAYSVTPRVGSTFTWTIVNGTKTSGGNTASIQVLWNTAGAASVKVQESASNGCKGLVQTKTINVIDNVGLTEVNELRQLSLSPNPASQQVMVRFESISQQPIQLRVVNVLGQTVLQHDMQTKVGSNEKVLMIDQLRQGVYFIELDNGTEKVSRRLMVQ